MGAGSSATARRLLLLVAVTAALAAWSFVPSGLPDALVSVIHEGTTRDDVLQLFGAAGHGDPGYALYERLAGPPDAVRLPSLAALNLGLWILAVAASVLLAARAAGSLALALGLGIAVFVTTPSIATALSESPGVLIAALGCAAAAPVVARRGGRLGGPALLLFGAAALLSITVRRELALVALPAVGLELLARSRPAPPRRPTSLRGLALRLLLLAVGLLAADELLGLLSAPLHVLLDPHPTASTSVPHHRWIASALLNLPRHAHQLAWALWTDLPAAVVLLAALGWGASLLVPSTLVTLRGLPLSLPLLASLYLAAAHGDAGGALFEARRYLAPTLPGVLLFATLGARALATATARDRRGRALVCAALFALALPLAGWPRAIRQRSPWQPWLAAHGRLSLPPAHDVQREVRFLLRALRDHPRCVLVALLDPPPGLYDPDAPARYLAFDATRRRTLAARDRPALLRELPRALPGPACALLYRGLDCNAAGGSQCAGELHGLPEVVAESFPSLPYTHPSESHPRPPVTRFALYRLRWQSAP